MSLVDGVSVAKQTQQEGAFGEAFNSATSGVLRTGFGGLPDSLQAFGDTAATSAAGSESKTALEGGVANAASVPSPGESVFLQDFGVVNSFLTDPSFAFSNVISDFAGVFTPGLIFEALPTALVSTGGAQSGEEVVSDKIVELGTRMDDLMKEAAGLDLSTAEGQKRLGEIQLEFTQIQRLMTALSEMMKKFDDLQQQIISNF